jgi:hypothetical protein
VAKGASHVPFPLLRHALPGLQEARRLNIAYAAYYGNIAFFTVSLTA